jgi:large subunit ribosomal protein L18e
MKQPKSTNPELVNLVRSLRKKARQSEAKIWRVVANYLSNSRRRRVTVNLSKINRYTEHGQTVVIPGKVLGAGKIDHSLNVAAFVFSEQARSKILESKGKCMSIPELMDKNPKGSHVKLIG